MWWYEPGMLLVVLPTGGAGPSDVADTDSGTLTEGAPSATLAAVAVETYALSESPIVLLVVTATDTAALNDANVVTLLGNVLNALETFTVTDVLTSLSVAAVGNQSITLSEVVTALPVILTAVDTFALAESLAENVLVSAVDNASLTDIGTGQLISGGNATDSDVVLLSESAVANLAAAAVEAASVADAVVPIGIIAQLELLTFSEAAGGFAPLLGTALAAVSLAPRIALAEGQGISGWTWDSTYVTFDSTLLTFDGGYLGEVPQEMALEPKTKTTVRLADRLSALVGVE